MADKYINVGGHKVSVPEIPQIYNGVFLGRTAHTATITKGVAYTCPADGLFRYWFNASGTGLQISINVGGISWNVYSNVSTNTTFSNCIPVAKGTEITVSWSSGTVHESSLQFFYN